MLEEVPEQQRSPQCPEPVPEEESNSPQVETHHTITGIN